MCKSSHFGLSGLKTRLNATYGKVKHEMTGASGFLPIWGGGGGGGQSHGALLVAKQFSTVSLGSV